MAMSPNDQAPDSEKQAVQVPILRPKLTWRKAISRIVMILAIIPLLVFLAFVGAVSFMDFNQYKPQLEAEFFEKTQRKLKINGEVNVSVIPFEVHVQQVELKNPDGFKSENLATLDSVQIELSVWQLFMHRKLAILGVELEKAQIYLTRNAAGENNWQRLKQHLASTEVSQNKFPRLRNASFQRVASVGRNAAPKESVLQWRLESFVMQNSLVTWQDEASKAFLTVDDFDLLSFDVSPKKPFKIVTNFRYHSSFNPAMFYFTLSSELGVDQSLSNWKLMNWSGNSRVVLPKRMKVPEMRIEMAGKKFDWNFKSRHYLVENAKFKSLKTNLKTSFSGQYGEKPEVKGHLLAENINLQKWLRHSGIKLPQFVNSGVLTKVSSELDWHQTAEALTLENLNLQWDDTQLKGNIWRQLSKDKSEAPQYRFDLNLTALDLDKYQALALAEQANQKTVVSGKLPAQANAQAETQAEATPAKTAQLNTTYLPLALPISTLRAMNADGHIAIGYLKAWNMQFNQIDLTLSAQNGRLVLAPLDAALYKGTLTSTLQIDVRGKTPAYQWSGKLKQVDLLPFLQDGWGFKKLEGHYSSRFNLHTRGVNGFLLRQNLTGSFQAKVDKGRMIGVDFNKLLAGKKTSTQDVTNFSVIQLDGPIKKGVYRLQRANVNSKRFSAIGTGQINLVKATLKNRLFLTYRQPPQQLMSLKGMEVPIDLKGPLDSPVWKVDVNSLLKSPANQKRLMDSLQNLILP